MSEVASWRRSPRLALVLTGLALWIVTRGYYRPHFQGWQSSLLAVAFVALVGSHLWMGRRIFRPAHVFPVRWFVPIVLGLSAVRWSYTYFVLRHHLPPSTVFHYPERVLWFLVPSSAALVLLGYGLAQHRYLRQRVALPPEEGAAAAADAVVCFRSEGKDVRLPVADLLYVQARGEYMLYHCADRRYLRHQRLKEAEVDLHPLGFVRVHRSYVVARAAIRAYSRTELELTDGTVLPISRTYQGVLE